MHSQHSYIGVLSKRLTVIDKLAYRAKLANDGIAWLDVKMLRLKLHVHCTSIVLHPQLKRNFVLCYITHG